MSVDDLLDIFTGYLELFEDNSLWYNKSYVDTVLYNTSYDSLNIANTITITDYYIQLPQVDSSSPYDRMRYNSSTDMIEIGTPDNIWVTINESLIDQDTRWYYNSGGDAYQASGSVGFGMDPLNVTAFTALPNSLISKKTYIDGDVILRVNRSDFLTSDQTTIEVQNIQDEEKSIQLSDFFTYVFGTGAAPSILLASYNNSQIQIDFTYDIYDLSFIDMGTTMTPDKLGIKLVRIDGTEEEYMTLDGSILSSDTIRTLTISEGSTSSNIDSSGTLTVSSVINIVSVYLFVKINSSTIYSEIKNIVFF